MNTDQKTVKLDKDGVPVSAHDWLDADWRDLHNGLKKIKAKIAARHRPVSPSVPSVKSVVKKNRENEKE